MIRPESDRPDGRSWLERLHDAIATDTEPPLDPTPLDEIADQEYAQLRNCLELLDFARRAKTELIDRPQRVGRFEIVREVGRGGFGVVFAAIDPRVGRQVALKVPHPQVLSSATMRARFLREARAAGGLSHPNLLPILEVGEDGPISYIATPFCTGPNLAHWLAGRVQPVDEREAALLVLSLAEGVRHAHTRGVLHRDIKPGNVLLEPRSDREVAGIAPESLCQWTPQLTDFGLAKMIDQVDDPTCSGVLIGTPAYMAPEQAEGRLRDVGPATDVYALGVLLYELLAGAPPLRGQTPVQTLQLVAQGEVPRLSQLRPGVSRDLEAIVMRCLERAPANRYRSAEKLGDDLRRLLQGESTLARPAMALERIAKWVRRRPAVAALYGVVLSACFLLMMGGWWYSAKLQAVVAELMIALSQVKASELETNRLLYATSVVMAGEALKSGHTQQVHDHLSRSIPNSGEPDLRGFAWHYLWNQVHRAERTLTGHTGDVYCVRYSPDGRFLATASQDQTARIWDATTGECMLVCKGHKGEVNCVAFDSTGTILASAGDDGRIIFWRTDTGEIVWSYIAHKGGMQGIDFSPDGNYFATSGADCRASLWSTHDKQRLVNFDGHYQAVGAVAFSPSSRLLATCEDGGFVRVWDVASHELTHRLSQDSSVTSAHFSADESQLLTTTRGDCKVRLWDLATGQLIKVASQHFDWVHDAEFVSPGIYAVGTKEPVVELIRSDDGVVVGNLHGHTSRVWSLDVSPDGERLATASADDAVRVWNLTARQSAIDSKADSVHLMALTPDGRSMATFDTTGLMKIYNVASRSLDRQFGYEYQIVGDFDGDGRNENGSFQDGVWRIGAVDPADRDRILAGTERTLRFGCPGDLPVVGDWNGDGRADLGYYRPFEGVFALDLDGQGEEPEKTQLFGPKGLPGSQQIPLAGRWESPDFESIALARYMSPRRWEMWFPQGDKSAVVTVASNGDYSMPIKSSKGRWGLWREGELWSTPVPADGWVTSVDDPSLQRQETWVAANFVKIPAGSLATKTLDEVKDRAYVPSYVLRGQSLALSPDGTLVALAFEGDNRVKIIQATSGRHLATLRTKAGTISQVAFAPDGHTLAVGTSTGFVLIYDAATFRAVHKFRAHATLQQLCFAPDGQTLVTAGDSGAVMAYSCEGNRQRTYSAPGSHMTMCLATSPSGRFLAAGCSDRTARVWNLATCEIVGVFAGHAAEVTHVAFSADENTLVTATRDGAIRLWDMHTGQQLLVLKDSPEQVKAIAFSAATGELIAATDRATIHGRTGTTHFWSPGKAPSSP